MLGGTRARLAGAGRPGGPMDDSGRMEAVTYYWHFVDAVWLLVFLSLYVL
jgi:heme/copper-type cytochrome/quinol oxidase subunit 3